MHKARSLTTGHQILIFAAISQRRRTFPGWKTASWLSLKITLYESRPLFIFPPISRGKLAKIHFESRPQLLETPALFLLPFALSREICPSRQKYKAEGLLSEIGKPRSAKKLLPCFSTTSSPVPQRGRGRNIGEKTAR